jgi:alkyl hydroperoxide reductase subunit F
MDFNLGFGTGDKKEKNALKANENTLYDLLILGGGPSGASAAIYAVRKGLKTALVSVDIGGQLNWTSSVENYLGYNSISAFELIENFKNHLEEYPVELAIGEEIVSLIKKDDVFYSKTASGKEYKSKTVIIATGKRSRELGLENEKRLRGKGVSYCVTCDGPLFRDKRVVVVGGGNSAVEGLLDLQNIASAVSVVNITEGFTADKIITDKLDLRNIKEYHAHIVVDVKGENRLETVVIKDKNTGKITEIDAEGIFIEIGLIPNTGFINKLTSLNNWGEVIINHDTTTNVEGLYASGDVTNVPEKQIVIAAGEGAKAALAVNNYLIRI